MAAITGIVLIAGTVIAAALDDGAFAILLTAAAFACLWRMVQSLRAADRLWRDRNGA